MNVTVERIDDLSLHQYIGPDARPTLERAGLSLPTTDFHTAAQGDGFVARLASDDWLVANLEVDVVLSSRCWAFERSDGVFALEGSDVDAVMQQLCAHDYRGLVPGDWLMSALAGIDVWIYAPSAAPQRLIIGCDPSHDRYLAETLDTVARDVRQSETTSRRD